MAVSATFPCWVRPRKLDGCLVRRTSRLVSLPEAVISDGLWRRAYGADPNVLGRTIRLDNDPLTIIGVLPRGFRHPGPTTSGDAEVFGAGGFSGDPFPAPMRGTPDFSIWNRTT